MYPSMNHRLSSTIGSRCTRRVTHDNIYLIYLVYILIVLHLVHTNYYVFICLFMHFSLVCSDLTCLSSSEAEPAVALAALPRSLSIRIGDMVYIRTS